ncbi:MAG: DJ-1/PfpI family protein [Planctomycetes bacterium]|nr:DJ-1/PfpI family protein [Planctomycetota bacterium]
MKLRALPLFLGIAIAFGCRTEPAKTADLKGKKALIIIAKKGYRDEELNESRSALEKSGAGVTLACSSLGTATGMLGGTAEPTIALKDVKVDDYDVIIFVGGVGAEEYFDNPKAHEIAREAAKSKLLCAICIAPTTLARAGVLKGRRATVFSSKKGELTKGGADYTGAAVQVDGNIITASGPKAARGFANAIIDVLSAK